jgi:hypothetical protein
MASQIIPHPYAYDAHSPERRQFSVLCWRGWCDNDYRDREIAAMVGMVSGVTRPVSGLPARQCPSLDTCQCECHDGKRGETEGQQQ